MTRCHAGCEREREGESVYLNRIGEEGGGQ